MMPFVQRVNGENKGTQLFEIIRKFSNKMIVKKRLLDEDKMINLKLLSMHPSERNTKAVSAYN